MDFGRPIAEIGRKMASARLLFLALCKQASPNLTIHKECICTPQLCYNSNF